MLNYDKLNYKSNQKFLFRTNNNKLSNRSREARRRRSAGRRGSDSDMSGKLFIFLFLK
jgi:hypothetical protein